MPKRISIDELRPGMQIEKLDRSWLATPFLRHKMTITSHEQIAQLKASGVRTLMVHGETADIPTAQEPALDSISDPALTAPDDTASASSTVPLGEELPSARHTYQAAKCIVQRAMQDTKLGRAINMDEVNRVVSDMTESVLRNPDALTKIGRAHV